MRLRHSLWMLLAMLLALLVPSPALSEPSPPCDITPACISLVGTNGIAAAPTGEFTVIARDLACNPLAGASVVIDLSACPDLFLCADQLDPAVTVDCANKTARKLTGADGSVRFTILGGSNGAGNAVTLLGGGRIFKNGGLIGAPTVSAFDLDGANGVGAGDLSAWLTDFGSGNPFGRSDYDCSGSIGAGDLSFWLSAFASGASTLSCASQCP